MWPVIIRELQAQARHSFTYWLRELGAGALLLVAAWFAVETGFSTNRGGPLFVRLHLMLLCSIWLLVPLVTADCISRERREGTLGLLFLTPLTARSIVLAKTLSHGLRALTMCMAVLPILTLPFLIGGVSWQEAALSAETNFSCFCWAVAAGVLASSWMKAWLRSLVWALGFAVAFGLAFAFLNSLLLASAFYPYVRSTGFRGGFLSLVQSPAAALVLVTDIDEVWKEIFGKLPGVGRGTLFWAAAGVGGVSLLFLCVIIEIAARNVRHHWQEEPPSARRLWLERIFCTPVVWVKWLQRWMRWRLEHNPIGWLEQRTWSARLVTWSWLATMIALLSVGIGEVTPGWSGDGFSRLEASLAWLLAGSVAMSASASFRRERENGVLELLLVSPIGVREIVSGRLRGIWSQFIPAAGLLFATWLYLGSAFGQKSHAAFGSTLFFAVTFATLPAIGLFYSLRESNFLFSFVWTVSVGILFPLFAGGVTVSLWQAFISEPWQLPDLSDALVGPVGLTSFLANVVQVTLARFLLSRLRRNLSRRRFAF